MVLLTHGDSIDRVGTKLKVSAYSSNKIVAGIYNEQMRIYGVQFHPEVCLTKPVVQKIRNLFTFLIFLGGSNGQRQRHALQLSVRGLRADEELHDPQPAGGVHGLHQGTCRNEQSFGRWFSTFGSFDCIAFSRSSSS